MSIADDWQLLGIAPTDDRREIKRAYGRVLKEIDVDADAASFIRLRQALENTLEWGIRLPWWEEDADDERVADPLAEDGLQVDAELDPEDRQMAEMWEHASHEWRMPPPVAEGELGQAMSRLDTLLFEQPGDPTEIAELGVEILGSAQLEHVDTAARTEEWMADTIVAAMPASDPLVDRAIRHFGWDRQQASRASYAVQAVLERSADRRKLAAIEEPSHPHHNALKELRGSGRTHVGLFQQDLVNDVADFLSYIRTSHPTIEKDVAGPQLEWWQNYIAARPLPKHFWILMLAGSFLFTLIGVALVPKSTGVGVRVPIILGSILLSYLLLRGWMELQRIALRLHDQDERYGIDKHLPLLSAAIFGSPVLFAAVPPGTVQLTFSIILSVLLAVAAFLRCAPRQWEDEGSRWGRRYFPIGAGILSVCILVETRWEVALQLAAPLTLCCWFGVRGWHPWALFLEDAPERKLLILQSLVFGVLMVAATATIIGISAQPSLMLLVSVPLAVLLQHLVLASTPIYLLWLEWPLRTAAALFFIALPAFRSEPDEGLARFTLAAMLYLIAFCLAKIGTSLLQRIRTGLPSKFWSW